MSMLFEDTVPPVRVISSLGDIMFSAGFGNVRMPMTDFCFLVEYVLENTDMTKEDPRRKLIKRICKGSYVKGYNKDDQRFKLGEKSK